MWGDNLVDYWKGLGFPLFRKAKNAKLHNILNNYFPVWSVSQDRSNQ